MITIWLESKFIAKLQVDKYFSSPSSVWNDWLFTKGVYSLEWFDISNRFYRDKAYRIVFDSYETALMFKLEYDSDFS